MYKFNSIGDWRKTFTFLHNGKKLNSKIDSILRSTAEKGLNNLIQYTPKDTGLASDSWSYDIKKTKNAYKITWLNNDIEGGYNVAILVQYGHGTGTGGYVVGRDYINPAIQPLFDALADELWKEVNR